MERKRGIPLQFWSIIMTCVLSDVGWCNGGTVKKVMSVGDNATFDCYPPRNSANHVTWSSRNSPNPTELIVFVDLSRGVESTYPYPNFQGDRYSSNFVQAWTGQKSKFTMSIRNLTVEDSSNYVCEMLFFDGHNPVKLMQHQIIVIGCKCSPGGFSLEQNLSCAIDGYHSTSSEYLTIKVTMNDKVTQQEGILQMNILSIPVKTGEISRITRVEFNPLSHESFQSLVSCSLPTFTTSNPDVPTISSISTGSMSSPPHTTIYDVPEEASSKISLTTKGHISPKSNTMTIVATVVGILLLSVVAMVVVLFLYRQNRKCRALGNSKGIPDDEKTAGAVEEMGVSYASVHRHRGDTSTHVYARSIEKTKAESEESIGGAHNQNQHRHREEESPNEGFVDNMLYQSTDMVPADANETMEMDSLYAMPDKPMKSSGSRFTTSSVNKTARKDECSSIGRYPPRAGRYSAVDLSVEHNAGTSADMADPHDKPVQPTDNPTEDCDVALLYAVPDKGPRASRNGDVDSTHAEGACSLTLSRDATEDFGQLYAQVDKRSKTLQK